ncbi:hypothetical protein ACP4OV_010320 [Aristida adscensionis]
MADLVLGLAKTAVEGTVTVARSAMEEEEKLQKTVQRDLLVISDEFEMMHSFLKDAKGRVTHSDVMRTLVRQVRNTALDVEDCIEIIVHLDKKPRWWRRMMLPWCMPAAAPWEDVDAAVANLEKLKARVEAMGHRNLRYNRTGDPAGLKSISLEQVDQQAVANAMVPSNLLPPAADAAKKQSSEMDLVTLINKKAEKVDDDNGKQEGKKDGDDGKQEEKKDGDDGKQEERKDDEEKQEGKEVIKGTECKDDRVVEAKQEGFSVGQLLLLLPQRCREASSRLMRNKQPQPRNPNSYVHQLQVISVLGIGSDLEIMSMKKAYEDSETCKNFMCRAWVKLVHPFNPIEFIRSLLVQFYRNSCPKQEKTADFPSEVLVATDKELIVDYFMRQVSQRYLVVLEDVSTMVDWEVVRGYLPDKSNGSCVLVHTRQRGIACSCVGPRYRELELEKLSADRSVYVLLKEDAPGKDNDEDTVDTSTTAYESWLANNELFGRQETDLRWLAWHAYGRRGTYPRRETYPHVVSVWGMSGVGKSYLIQHFYRKQRHSWGREYKFGWVDVSRPFHVRDFCRSLHSQLNPAPQMSTIKDPIQECREYLQRTENHSYFIVIDGLQRTQDWESIKPIFELNTSSSNNSKPNVVIIITNEESVASYCSKEEGRVWNVKGLEVGHAIELFKKVVPQKWLFSEDADAEIKHRNEETMEILVQKCGGLPKVICAVAQSWKMVEKIKVEDNLVKKLEGNKGLKDTCSWLHSYFDSCPDDLKPCIFYLSIYPVNHTIRRRRLVRRWIAEGYIRDSKETTAEENGERSFSKLVNLSMIQAPRTRVDDRRMPLCQVNGFLREYIISELMEENLVFALEGHCKKNLQRTGRHLAIHNSWDRDRNVFESMDLSLLRSLTVFGKWESFMISDKMKLLRVLDLEDVSSGVTNGDVEQMVKLLPRLKFLSLRGCREISHLPDSLGDMKQLQTLDIRETSVIKLPKSIIKLEKLQYIRAGTIKHHQASEAAENLSAPMSRPLGSCLSKLSKHHHRHGSHSGVKVPRGIGKLSSLHTMGVVNIHATGEDDFLEELKNLTQLHKLGVSGINRNNSERFFSYVSHLAHLESLSLKMQSNQDSEASGCIADISSPPEKLRSLKLYGLVDRLPSWIMQMCLQLPRLEKLDLQMKTLPQQELDFILQLRFLRSLCLRLTEFQDGELRFGWTFDERSGDWLLYFLEIACNSRLRAVKFGSKIDVEILKIRCCSVSSSLKFSGLQSMNMLKEVWLSGTYEHAFKEHLESELNRHKNKPILKQEGASSST